jgi:dTDP-4-dehydrorhamnose reductase
MINILITGSDGQLGEELKIVATKYKDYSCIFTDIGTLDITDNASLKQFFNNHTINYIVNCAAYTMVDKAETDKFSAEKVNVSAVANLVKMANNHQSKLIHISTDYVFDGKANIPYKETSSVNPQSVYGLTKLNGEIEAQRYIYSIILRTSWLYSPFGKNFVKTMLELSKAKNDINVVFDQVGTPTYAADLADVIFSIIDHSIENAKNFKPGIYHYSNEGVCSWYDFAFEIFKLTKSDCKINPVGSSEFPTVAKRPNYSVLDKSKIKTTFNLSIPNWRDSLERCIEQLKLKNE